ncbi:MAG: peptidase M28 family protein, partial [Bacteroidota bacterium]
MKLPLLFLLLAITVLGVRSQTEDEKQLKAIYDKALTDGKAYDWLNHLSNQIGGRLSGSVQAQQAVEYTKKQLDSIGLDRVWLQPVMVPKWVRGTPEFAYIETKPGITTNVPICALGGSVATPDGGLKAKVVEV